MKLFNCQHCQALLFFENRLCGTCGSPLGYLPDEALLSVMRPDGAGFTATAADGRPVRLCANAAHDACNWLVDALPMTFALNNLNRSIGLSNLYPFIISTAVREKLGFIHTMLHEHRQG